MLRKPLSRRRFLAMASATSAAALTSTLPETDTLLESMAHPGFGLALIKAEGTTVAYDPASSRSAVIPRAEFGRLLADSLNEAFRDAYKDVNIHGDMNETT